MLATQNIHIFFKRVYILIGRNHVSSMEDTTAPVTFEQINGVPELQKITNPQYANLNVRLNGTKCSLFHQRKDQTPVATKCTHQGATLQRNSQSQGLTASWLRLVLFHWSGT